MGDGRVGGQLSARVCFHLFRVPCVESIFPIKRMREDMVSTYAKLSKRRLHPPDTPKDDQALRRVAMHVLLVGGKGIFETRHRSSWILELYARERGEAHLLKRSPAPTRRADAYQKFAKSRPEAAQAALTASTAP